MTSESRRAVFVSQRFTPDSGGNAARIHDLGTHLADRGWEVTVLAPPPSYPPGEFELTWRRQSTATIEGVTVHRLWSWQPQRENPGTVERLAYYLLFGIHAMLWLLWNGRRMDIIVTTTPPISTGAPGLCANALGTPWVVDVRDLWIDASISLGYLEAGSLLERVSRRFQRLVLHRSDRIAVTTGTLGEALSATYGESLADKTVLIPNGVDVDRFRPVDSDEEVPSTAVSRGSVTEADRKQRNPEADTPNTDRLNGGKPTIIYTGNLGSAQDLESCIRAMAHLSNESALLRLVGGGDAESRLRRLTDELGLDDRVKFEGVVPRERVPELLAEATIGIAPLQTFEELEYAMPTKVYEYMASGLPTLVTGRGEIERFIDESGGGVHVDADPHQIAEQLDELLADSHLRRQLGANGRTYVASAYDRNAIAGRLSDEMTELIRDNATA